MWMVHPRPKFLFHSGPASARYDHVPGAVHGPAKTYSRQDFVMIISMFTGTKFGFCSVSAIEMLLNSIFSTHYPEAIPHLLRPKDRGLFNATSCLILGTLRSFRTLDIPEPRCREELTSKVIYTVSVFAVHHSHRCASCEK